MAEGILFYILCYISLNPLWHSTLCHNYNAESSPSLCPLLDNICNIIYLKGLFRDEYHIRAACKAAVSGNPPCVPSHHLNNHCPVMRLCGCMKPVKRLCYNAYCCIKTEGKIRA